MCTSRKIDLYTQCFAWGETWYIASLYLVFFFFVEWLYNSFEMSSSGRGIFADIAVSIL